MRIDLLPFDLNSSHPEERLEEYELASRFARFSGRLADADLRMVVERFSADPENSHLVRLLAHVATQRAVDLSEAVRNQLWSRNTETDWPSSCLPRDR